MMLSRRELVGNGLLLSAVGGLAPALTAARPLPADVFIIDERMPGASEALTAASARPDVLTFSADPGSVWIHRLEPRLKSAPFAIGGYTSASALFCLHYLARDYGLTLAGVAEGASLPEPGVSASDALVDLRDPRFGNQRAAFTWLMLPGRT